MDCHRPERGLGEIEKADAEAKSQQACNAAVELCCAKKQEARQTVSQHDYGPCSRQPSFDARNPIAGPSPEKSTGQGSQPRQACRQASAERAEAPHFDKIDVKPEDENEEHITFTGVAQGEHQNVSIAKQSNQGSPESLAGGRSAVESCRAFRYSNVPNGRDGES